MDAIWNSGSLIIEILRTICIAIDMGIYFLLSQAYQLFFAVASINLLSGDSIVLLFNRIQLVVGIYIVFKLVFSAINGLINPEAFVDKKSGVGNIVSRTLLMLFMLLMVVPINIPNASNSFEIQVNNNGVLFGTLYTLQDRILYSNTIGRMVLGTPAPENLDEEVEVEDELSNQNDMLAEGGSAFTAAIMKTFVQISMNPDAEGSNYEDYNNYACSNDGATIFSEYSQADTIDDVFELVDTKCENSEGDEIFAYSYLPGISGIAGIVLIVCFVAWSVDVAIRTFKLMILRLIAPIPIVSYIDPKSAKDGAFGSWVKNLSIIYLSLFFRLFTVYFGLFLVNTILSTDTSQLLRGNVLVASLTIVVLVIGVFAFISLAPKFIKDVLGLKNQGLTNIGMSALLGGAGAIASHAMAPDHKDKDGNSMKKKLGFGSVASGMFNAAAPQVGAISQGKAAPGSVASFLGAGNKAAQRITGNERMTLGRQAVGFLGEHGLGPLAGANATDAKSEALKGAMYAYEDNVARTKDLLKRMDEGQVSAEEFLDTARKLGVEGVPDASQFDSEQAKAAYISANKDAVRSKLYRYSEEAQVVAGKTKKEFEDMTKLRSYYGRDENFDYKYYKRSQEGYTPEYDPVLFIDEGVRHSVQPNIDYIKADGKPDTRTYADFDVKIRPATKEFRNDLEVKVGTTAYNKLNEADIQTAYDQHLASLKHDNAAKANIRIAEEEAHIENDRINKEIAANNAMLNEAHAENADYDARKRREQTQVINQAYAENVDYDVRVRREQEDVVNQAYDENYRRDEQAKRDEKLAETVVEKLFDKLDDNK